MDGLGGSKCDYVWWRDQQVSLFMGTVGVPESIHSSLKLDEYNSQNSLPTGSTSAVSLFLFAFRFPFSLNFLFSSFITSQEGRWACLQMETQQVSSGRLPPTEFFTPSMPPTLPARSYGTATSTPAINWARWDTSNGRQSPTGRSTSATEMRRF